MTRIWAKNLLIRVFPKYRNLPASPPSTTSYPMYFYYILDGRKDARYPAVQDYTVNIHFLLLLLVLHFRAVRAAKVIVPR
jgi:hypothetical protein